MKTNPHSTTRSLVLAALFLALAFVLPMITGHVPQVGNMLCPMHFPILLCGFVLGGPWGLAVGFIAPLVRSVLFGISNDVAMQMVGVGFIIGVVQDSVETALNSAGDVEFAATAEYHQWRKQGKPLPEFLSGKKN